MATQRMGSRGRTERSVSHSEVRRPAEAIAASVVYFIFGVIAVILALRFALRLLGASTQAAFVQIVYSLAAPFMAPFEAVFPTQQVEGSVFEWNALLAIVIYLLIAWGIVALIRAVTPRHSVGDVESVESVDEVRETENHPGTRVR